MHDFDYDCLQKKRLARSASHRKCGAKSKKCSLSTDNMSQKQWKERCGPVLSINMYQPVPWETFKTLSPSTQESYLCRLKGDYGASLFDICGMFSISYATLNRHIRQAGLTIPSSRGRQMTEAQRLVWADFCASALPAADPELPAPAEDPAPLPIPVPPGPVGSQLRHFSVVLSGELTPSAVANSLRLILGETFSGEIEISFVSS